MPSSVKNRAGQSPTSDLGWGRRRPKSGGNVNDLWRGVGVPSAPTIGIATATGTTTASVPFTAPASNGSPIISYTATSSPGGITGTLTQAGSGTISMTGLTAGTSYIFTVKATNAIGVSAPSQASNSITTTSLSVVTGGTLTSDGTYYFRTFNGSDTLGVTVSALSCDYLVVAGGAGGSGWGGAGGAGGYLTSIGGSPVSLSINNYSVTIGGGGAGASYGSNGSGGGSSSFNGISPSGGGGGGDFSNAGLSGGSGGGAGVSDFINNSGGTGTSGQGNAGGSSVKSVNSNSNARNGGGGGGAGATGGSGYTSGENGFGGGGGSGIASSISGSSVTRGGGGGGGTGDVNTPTGGAGGAGGGGAGASYYIGGGPGGAGTANTGGGGGAGMNNTGGNGGSGIVIIRYTRSQVE